MEVGWDRERDRRRPQRGEWHDLRAVRTAAEGHRLADMGAARCLPAAAQNRNQQPHRSGETAAYGCVHLGSCTILQRRRVQLRSAVVGSSCGACQVSARTEPDAYTQCKRQKVGALAMVSYRTPFVV